MEVAQNSLGGVLSNLKQLLYFRRKFGIADGEIFEKMKIDDMETAAPQGVRLYGPPGAGKTTYLRHLVHTWSTDFLEKVAQKWTIMVYIPARDINSTVKQAIKDHLWCEDEDKDFLMDHIQRGEGVAIVVDAIDEVRKENILDDLQRYAHTRQTQGGAKILVSARNGLCFIDPQHFNRFLTLDGFTLDQGFNFIEQYFALGKPLLIHQTAKDYVNRHKDKMEAVLCNPLKLHIFCALTEKGFITLDENFKFEVLNIFEPLEKYLTTREGGNVTNEESQNFYKLCFFALLSGMRRFPQHLLMKFTIVDNYKAFLVREEERNQNAELMVNYSFTHEMVFEYFSSKYIEGVDMQSLKSLLLLVCYQTSLRNLQKIIFELILRKKQHKDVLLLMLIRGIILLQFTRVNDTQNIPAGLLQLQDRIKSAVNIEQVMLSHQDAGQIREADAIWEVINRAFDSEAGKLRAVGWFLGLGDNGTLEHIVDCLRVCTPQEQKEIIRRSLYCLLPCTYMDK